MNIGITADGRIIPIFEERLRQMGINTLLLLCCAQTPFH